MTVDELVREQQRETPIIISGQELRRMLTEAILQERGECAGIVGRRDGKSVAWDEIIARPLP